MWWAWLLGFLVLAAVGLAVAALVISVQGSARKTTTTGPVGAAGATGEVMKEDAPAFRVDYMVLSEPDPGAPVNVNTGLVNPMGMALDDVASTGGTDVFWLAVNTLPISAPQVAPSTLMRFAYLYAPATGPVLKLADVVSVTGPASPQTALTDVYWRGSVGQGLATGFVFTSQGLTGPAELVAADQFGRVFAYNRSVDSSAVAVLNHFGAHAAYYGCEILDDVLYLANWTSGYVEMYDANWNSVGQFTDADTDLVISDGYHPYSLHQQNNVLFVGFALNSGGDYAVPGNGNSFVTMFAPGGTQIARFSGLSYMNAPAGFAAIPAAQAPSVRSELWVSDWGNGYVQRFDLRTNAELGLLRTLDEDPWVMPQIHSILFPPRANAPSHTPLQIIVTAGPLSQIEGVIVALVEAPPQ